MACAPIAYLASQATPGFYYVKHILIAIGDRITMSCIDIDDDWRCW